MRALTYHIIKHRFMYTAPCISTNAICMFLYVHFIYLRGVNVNRGLISPLGTLPLTLCSL